MTPRALHSGAVSSLELARASYREISLYAPDRSPCAIDLSDNTNLFGVPPMALGLLRGAAESWITRYPTLYAGGLKAALARYAGVEEREIVTGCGSDDVLDSAIRAFAEPGESIAMPEPSFAMIPIFARMNGLRPVSVPLLPNCDVDVEALLATGARIIYVCSPNNPTGSAASEGAIRHLLAEAPGLIILDEAYAEFAGHGWITEAPRQPRLLVVRTMSKAFGLAGLRIGYAAGAESLVAEVEKSRGPYKVNALAERAATAAVEHDSAWVQARIAEAVENRERFAGALRDMGLAPMPSVSNFLLVPVDDASAIGGAMRASGVAVRPMPGLPVVGDALRISIGPWPMMAAALDALRMALR